MGLPHPLVLDAAYSNNKAQEEHCGNNSEDESKVWKVSCYPEAISSQNGRRTNPAEVVQVPESSTAQGCQLKDSIEGVTQVELVYPKEAKEE